MSFEKDYPPAMDVDVEELTALCKRRAGDSLRGVFTYSGTDAEVVYARPDTRDHYRDGGLELFRQAAWEVHEALSADGDPQPLGEYRATVHTFRDGFALQFRADETGGVVVSLDAAVGSNLHSFLMECEERL